MGVLADIFSTGNTLKRRLNKLIQDPLGEIGAGVARFGEDQNALINLMRNAYPMAGERTVLNSPEQIAQFRKELADKGTDQAMAAATVWHGSPHKFDKFDSSKIGTGEGNQAYGHGLYFADAQDVARSYAEANSKASLYQGKKLLDPNTLSDTGKAAAKSIAAQGWDNAVKAAREMRSNGADPVWMDSFEASLQSFKKSPPRWVNDKAQLYKVDLPDEAIAKMLDWDKPLSQQYIKPDTTQEYGGFAPFIGDQRISKPARTIDRAIERVPTGAEAYSELYKKLGSADKVADYLRQQGIPGIRYLDGGSRGTGAGTSNFVVFPGNENLLQILERNGQPVNQLNKMLK